MRNEELLESKNFLTPREFREVFDGNLSVTTINRLIKAGRIPVTKLGRKNLIPVGFARAELAKGGLG